tara:strand:+ start:1610 stop:2815 length:1206 start_codon:yes stop_codon:yes gene_type:complete
MKKILGSPIGLGELNLTVDNRVRRCIKEYFGNVDNNEFAIRPMRTENNTNITKTGKYYIKIGVKAPEELLNKTFIIDLPDKYEFFIPIKKNGDWLESKPLFMDKDSFDIINNQSNPRFAKLPTTDIEKEAATLWKDDKLGTQDATDDAELGATGKTKKKEAVSALKENDCEYEASICCNEDEWKEEIKKRYGQGIEANNIMIFVCVLLILLLTNIHISWAYYGLRIAFLGKNLTPDQESTKKYFKEKREKTTTCRFCFLWKTRLGLAFIMAFVVIPGFISGINKIKKKIKEIDSKTIKDISKDDKEKFLKDCLKTRDEQAEERRRIEECESDVTKEWDKSDEACVDKCTRGSICKGDKCETCGCPEGEIYRLYPGLNCDRCHPKCPPGMIYSKSRCGCKVR